MLIKTYLSFFFLMSSTVISFFIFQGMWVNSSNSMTIYGISFNIKRFKCVDKLSLLEMSRYSESGKPVMYRLFVWLATHIIL